MDILIVLVTFIIIVIGIAGTFLPVLPGIPLVFAAIAAFGWYEGFQTVTPRYLVIIAGITVLSLFIDYLSVYMGSKYFKSSKKGMYGAILGSVAGLFIFPPIGLLVCPWLGAIIGELIEGNDWDKAFISGLGAVIGLFTGIAVKVIIAVGITISFLIIIL